MKNIQEKISELQSGKEAGLVYFMEEYSHKLRFFSFKIVKDKNIAEEIMADAFIKLWDRRANFTCAEKIKSFLFLTTRNACLDIIKQSRNKFQHTEDFLSNLESPESDILSQIIYLELIEIIAIEIEKLPKLQAQIFQLTYFDGKDTTEICEELNTTASTVYFARSKALSALKQIFKQKNISYYHLYLMFWLF